jgi:hypothetical protein
MSSTLYAPKNLIEVTSRTGRTRKLIHLVASLSVLLSFVGCAGIPSTAVTAITTSQLANAQPGLPYATALTATGGRSPYRWSITSGALPLGVNLNTLTGALSGVPAQVGSFKFIVQVSDSSAPAPETSVRPMTLVVVPVLQIATSGLPDVEVGVQFRTGLIAAGGTQPYRNWSIVSGLLPSGISLDVDNGVLSGTASQEGEFDFSAQVSDSSGPKPLTAMKALTLTVVAIALQIMPNELPGGQVGVPFQAMLTASGGVTPYAWTVTSGQLPPGIALNSATGKLEGTPTSAGQYSFTVQVQDSGAPPQSASQAFSVAVTVSSALDQYGGDAKHACAGTMPTGSTIPGATGFFYLYKDTNAKRWFFCDPLGNRFFMQSVQVIDGYYGGGNVDLNAKYGGGPYDYFSRQATRLQNTGFNTIGEYAHNRMLPACTQSGTGNPNPMPFVTLIRPSYYSLVSGSTSPKGMVSNLPPAYNQYRGSNFVDVFDPQWTTSVDSWFSATDVNFCNGGSAAGLDTNTFLIGVTMDDTDQLYGFKSGTHSNLGWMVGVSAPYMASEYLTDHSTQIVYADSKNYTKDQFKAYITGLYGTVVALNTAWASSYTTFGSTATTVTGETIGTGNGVATSFSHTLVHVIVDPASVGITVGGALQAGDCPWFNASCGGSFGTGIILSATGNISGGTITYSSGAMTVTFSLPPANGTAIVATYQYGGWPKATAGGTGLMDEDGSSTWYPTNPLIGAQGGPAISGQVATDLDHFYLTFLTQYFSTINARLKTALPHHLIFGPDSINVYAGSYGKSQVYNIEGKYVDVLEVAGGSGDAPTMNTVYATTSKPVLPYFAIVADEDSFFYYISNPFQHCVIDGWDCQHTQVSRGTEYFNVASAWWSSFAGDDNYHYTIGWNWWQYVDRNSEQENFGLVSLNDNLYDGVESTVTKIVDPLGLVTTPETRNYGDFISHVKTANRLWLDAP